MNHIEVVGNEEERKSLFAKLINVNKSIEKVPKSGLMSAGVGGKYGYMTEEDVIVPLSKVLAENNLATVPSVVDHQWNELKNTKGGFTNTCTIRAELLIGDADSGAYVVASTYASASNGDKASTAAFTVAMKYLLSKTALLVSGEDADDYNNDGEKASARLASRGAKELMRSFIINLGKQDQSNEFIKSNKINWDKITEDQLESLRLHISQ